MTALAVQAELQKLARALGCAEADLVGVAALDVPQLRQLRRAVVASLFEGDRAMLHKVVATSRMLPASISALIAEKALGPVLCARVAGLMPPEHAAELARRVSVAFNTQVTLLIDPRSVGPMLKLLPLELIVAVAKQCCARKEFIAMGSFVDVLSNSAIRAVMDVLDDEALLRIGFYVESADRLEEVVGLMSAQRLQNIVAVSASEQLNLSAEIMMLISGVGDGLRIRLAEAAAAGAPHVLDRMLEAAREHGMLDTLQQLSPRMNAVTRKRITAFVTG
jgi:hypothetical protein